MPKVLDNNPTFRRAVGEVVKHRRWELGLTQQELSYRTGRNAGRSLIAFLEQENPTYTLRLESMFIFAKALEMTPSQFLERLEAKLEKMGYAG